MAIMEKKAFLGVQKKRLPSKRNKKKNLLNKVLDYLKSDSYLFAPLTSSSSSSPSDCRSYKIGIKENDEEKKKKKLVKKVGDYLMSDCYMYAPLVVPPSSKPLGVPPKGDYQCIMLRLELFILS
ncbi:hypothetical protein TIFTF001_031872 [Ficus carica]|uniref:Uncharacterized protein n=1 Tax=Ficus carica TaxID=3494 RepID=A0AA88DVF4_FICCA|nr:hypothetical protein TIFTF001_031872 [Ficus carica]